MNLEYLLEKVSAINKKYENIADVTGERFNIFKILKIESNEVRMHSALLAELLNPRGSHGQKEIFLKLFCEQFGIKDFNYNQATVNAGKYIGYISFDFTEGGFMDIIVLDKDNRAIIIENKIKAGDIKTQLLRYHNFGRKNCKSFNLFYLTLDGKDASDWSKSTLNEKDFERLSYSSDILNWLEKCKEKAVNHAILRETITQYIYLIKHLTHQTMNEQTKVEMIDTILKNPDNIESADNIATVWTDVRYRIIETIISKIIIDEYVCKSGLVTEVDSDYKLGKRGSSFCFYKPGWKYRISFYFGIDFDDVAVGIYPVNADDPKDLNFIEILNTKLSGIGKNSNYEGWAWVTYYPTWAETDWRDITDIMPSEMIKISKTIIEILATEAPFFNLN